VSGILAPCEQCLEPSSALFWPRSSSRPQVGRRRDAESTGERLDRLERRSNRVRLVQPALPRAGIRQDLLVATDPSFQDLVAEHHDWCPPYELCPQGATLDPLPPDTYYWKVHLFAWDWEPDSDTWSFVSARPPPPPAPPPLPPPPPPPPKPTCHVPAVRGKMLEGGNARHSCAPLSSRRRALWLVVSAEGACDPTDRCRARAGHFQRARRSRSS
jgi:hypothetical protein